MAKFICVAITYLHNEIWASPTFLQLLGNALLGYRLCATLFVQLRMTGKQCFCCSRTEYNHCNRAPFVTLVLSLVASVACKRRC